LSIAATGPTAQAQVVYDTDDYETMLDNLLRATFELRNSPELDPALFSAIRESGDERYIAPVLDIGFFTRGPGPINRIVTETLAELVGEDLGDDWDAYFEYAGRNDVPLPPGYAEFKGALYGEILDTRFEDFFLPGVQDDAQVNLVEAIWGGVRVDGIPSLVNAEQISPEEATEEGERMQAFCRRLREGGTDCSYPAPDEFVFGVSINGDTRAYPLRQLNWHEMFNDVIGSTPMYENAADTEPVCNFRAPTPFRALGMDGDRVFITGNSAGCPIDGWIDTEAVIWAAWGSDDAPLTVDEVTETLPDMGAGNEAAERRDGVTGRVDGMPIMLAYCTLCGSGVLYDATIPDLTYTDLEGNTVEAGETVLEFGSTGMLMRSNKLMYDRNTNTVWNALTGEPAFGPLVDSGVTLEILPVVISDWATWLEEHPDTSVLSLSTGFDRNYTNGEAYSSYFNNPDFIMFPVWQQDTSERENKSVVFGLLQGGERKAYPLDVIIPEVVTNDTVGGTDVVLVTRATPEREFFEPGGAVVRAYRSEGMEFTPTDDPLAIEDADGNVWQVTEAALVGPDGEELRRLGGHLAFWFGWYAYFPETAVYLGDTAAS
ncbi:MAG: DUF3179 domain-containing (seleno)protein, partial [Chloroflexota bacterium]